MQYSWSTPAFLSAKTLILAKSHTLTVLSFEAVASIPWNPGLNAKQEAFSWALISKTGVLRFLASKEYKNPSSVVTQNWLGLKGFHSKASKEAGTEVQRLELGLSADFKWINPPNPPLANIFSSVGFHLTHWILSSWYSKVLLHFASKTSQSFTFLSAEPLARILLNVFYFLVGCKCKVITASWWLPLA